MNTNEDYEDFWVQLNVVSEEDRFVLREKEKTYGDSWKKRGGVGAFMMLARKWDRIENQCSANLYDIFKCKVDEKDGLLDDIADLRRYLLLVETEIRVRWSAKQDEKMSEGVRVNIDALAKFRADFEQGLLRMNGLNITTHLDYATRKTSCDGEPQSNGYVNQDGSDAR